MIPVLKTKLPCYEELEKYIREIDANSVYSNYGPLNNKLSQTLSNRFLLTPANICLLSSGTSCLIASLWALAQQLNKNPSEISVGVPAWSFVATVQAALMLGSKIKFVDVDQNGFASPSVDLDVDILIVVAPFGEPIDVDRWLKYQKKMGIKILFDCASSFSTLNPSEIPAIVSCHATKGFSTGEGGFVICKDKRLIDTIRAFSNFGIYSSRVASSIGVNFKLSEINSAYGLAILDNEGLYLQPYLEQVRMYNEFISMYCSTIKPFNSEFMRTTYNVRITNANVSQERLVYALLASYGIEARSWWGKPLPMLSQIFPHISKDQYSKFSTSQKLCSQVLGLPIGQHINIEAQRYIIKSLSSTLDEFANEYFD